MKQKLFFLSILITPMLTIGAAQKNDYIQKYAQPLMNEITLQYPFDELDNGVEEDDPINPELAKILRELKKYATNNPDFKKPKIFIQLMKQLEKHQDRLNRETKPLLTNWNKWFSNPNQGKGFSEN